jgi:uncharacterized protein
MAGKKTLVLGASPKPDRYSNMAVRFLRDNGHDVTAVGNKSGTIADVAIETLAPDEIPGLDTVTLYLNPENQKPFYDYILALHPKRIIFNPGTENAELEQLAEAHGIAAWEACTLVLLRTGNY